MSKPARVTKILTIDRSILDYLERTRSHRSRSERANELLRRGIFQEQYEALEKEAAEFYARAGKKERAEAKAFARASTAKDQYTDSSFRCSLADSLWLACGLPQI